MFLPCNSFPESHNSPFITERGDKSQASLYPQLRSQSSGPGGAWGQPQARRQQTCPSLETSSAAGRKQDGWRGKWEIAPRSILLWGLRHPLQSLHRLPFKGPKRNQPEALYIYIFSKQNPPPSPAASCPLLKPHPLTLLSLGTKPKRVPHPGSAWELPAGARAARVQGKVQTLPGEG